MLAGHHLEQGQLTFRLEELSDGGVRVWVAAAASPDLHAPTDADSVTLNRTEAAELGALLGAVMDLLVRAHERGEAQSPPERSADEPPPREQPPSAAQRRIRRPKPRSN